MDREEHREASRKGGEASGGNVQNLRNQDRGTGLESEGGGSSWSGLGASGGNAQELRGQGGRGGLGEEEE